MTNSFKTKFRGVKLNQKEFSQTSVKAVRSIKDYELG